MTLNLNRLIITGNLGRDPRVSRSQDDSTSVANFSIAHDPPGRRDEESAEWVQQPTEWYLVTAYGAVAESLVRRRLGKGDKVVIEGKVRQTALKDEISGRHYTQARIIADRIQVESSARSATEGE